MSVPTAYRRLQHAPASRVGRIFELLAAFEWFVPSSLSNDELLELIKRHFQLVAPELRQKEIVTKRRIGVEVIAAPVATLARNFGRLQAATNTRLEGEPGEMWRSTLERIAAQLHDDALAVPERFTPPLFPKAGNPRVVGQPIVADRRECAQLSHSREEERALWSFMCAVEEDVWNAIIWQLVKQGSVDRNPFFTLLEMYAAGIYPLGVESDTLLIGEYSSHERSERLPKRGERIKDVSIAAYTH